MTKYLLTIYVRLCFVSYLEFILQEDALKTKYAEAEKTIISLKDTCEKLDILADSLEEDNRKFREENTKLTVSLFSSLKLSYLTYV